MRFGFACLLPSKASGQFIANAGSERDSARTGFVGDIWVFGLSTFGA